MQVNLKWDGRIPSGQRASNARELRQEIRREFSRQIRRHWRKEQSLLASAYARGIPLVPFKRHHYCEVAPDPEKHPFFRVNLCGFSVIPLVSSHNGLGCELEIRLLGDERPPFSDLDNQVKFLVDTLRMPHEDQIPRNLWGQGEDLFCLLEDDSLITKYCVEWLYGGGGSPASEEALLIARIVYNDTPSHPGLDRWR